jgi:hypothetical protein
MWPCGVITLLSELFVAERKAQVYGHFHQFLQSAPATASNLSKLSSMCIFSPFKALHSEYMCYDDGCHLRKYAANPSHQNLTPTTQILSHAAIVVDKLHMAGHVDKWCRKNCDPHLFRDLWVARASGLALNKFGLYLHNKLLPDSHRKGQSRCALQPF